MILTKDDYTAYYSARPEMLDLSVNSIQRDHMYTTPRAPNETTVYKESLHRHIIWALSATHPMLFVGFGMRDGFFLDVIKTVRQDFDLRSEQVHYAVMPYTSEERRLETDHDLKALGVRPVFYYVPEREVPDAEEDHSGLKHLISELARSVGVSTATFRMPVTSPDINDINRRMLER